MTEPPGNQLFPAPKPSDADRQRDPTTGLLPSQMLREAVMQGREILSPQPIGDDQIQPASIDLRLGEVAYRVRASFLPGAKASVRDKLAELSMHRIDLMQGAVLEKDCVYIVPLFEYVALRSRTSGFANPKSSIGRLDVFARVITDHGAEFDRIRDGDTALRRLHQGVGLVEASSGMLSAREAIRDGLAFTVDVAGDEGSGVVGYKARRHTDLIDVDRIDHYDPRDFWEPVYAHRGSGGAGGIVLDPHDFYILASREAVVVPPDHAAEMLPYHTFVGEFRVHFAGFFDPGFGTAESGGAGSRAVLEVRSHEVPFLIEDGQVLGRLVYERLITRPDKLYGRAIGSSYQSQGLALSKHFKKFATR